MPRYNKARGRWETDAHVVLPNGKRKRLRKRSPINTKAGARDYEQKAVRALLDSSTSGKSGPVPRFDKFVVEYFEKYAAGNNRLSTVQAAESLCRKYLVPAFGKLLLDEFTPEHIEAFKSKRVSEGLSPQSIKNMLTVLRRILNLAVEWKRTSERVAILMPKVPPAPFDHLSLDESRDVVAAAQRIAVSGGRHALSKGLYWYQVILLGFHTGMRAGELRGIQWGDIDLARGSLTVRRAIVLGREVPTKSGRERTIELTPEVLAMLKRMRADRSPRRDQRLFDDKDSQPFSLSGLARALARACKEAGVRVVHPHVMRHTFASQLVEIGTPLRVVQVLMGHSTITTTERYAHLAPGAGAMAIAKLGAASAEATRRAAEASKTVAPASRGSLDEAGQ